MTTITLQLPEDVYQRLQHTVRATRRPLEEVLFQSIRGNLPPSIDDVLPEWRDNLASLHQLDDQALWSVAREPFPQDAWRRHEALLEKNQEDQLSSEEQEEPERLRTAADRTVLRRSFALALLKWRGYTLL